MTHVHLSKDQDKGKEFWGALTQKANVFFATKEACNGAVEQAKALLFDNNTVQLYIEHSENNTASKDMIQKDETPMVPIERQTS